MSLPISLGDLIALGGWFSGRRGYRIHLHEKRKPVLDGIGALRAQLTTRGSFIDKTAILAFVENCVTPGKVVVGYFTNQLLEAVARDPWDLERICKATSTSTLLLP